MKKLTISLLAVIFSLGTAFSQPVSDMAVIPVGVTLNSILRLNVTNGGNLEYVVNTISQYQTGIAASALYQTHFQVASSIDFDVELYADGTDFIGVDDNTNTIDIGNLGYNISPGANVGIGVDGVNWDIVPLAPAAPVAVTNAAVEIIQGIVGASAGSSVQNNFIINWRFGTLEGTLYSNTVGQSLLEQNIGSDRYVATIFLHLIPRTP